ncbi:receptor-like protein EIX2 [Musa acuminata AAA Group]|uniref:receptor-like protein EIX2 n=1 Tax=Musa acuminata AAA Group TaxID=214697 RepID=UPI0031CF5AF8
MGERSPLLVIVFSLSVLCIELGISDGFSMIRCQETERKALMEFKQRLRDPSHRLSSWVGEDCCSWEGIRCTNVTGHVIELHLRNRHRSDVSYMDCSETNFDDDGCRWALHGGITPSLLSLQHLNHLDLSGNNFEGNRIPEFLGSFGRLTYLNLSGAGLAGRVPDQLGNLSTLHQLDLSYNFYPDDDFYKFLYIENIGWISRLTSLQHLNMNQVSFRNVSNWLQALNVLSSIQVIELVSCDLRTFPPSLSHGNFTSLTILNLEDNIINSTVPDWLFNITSLEVLSLGWNYLHGQTLDSIAKLTNLRQLDLSYNMFHNDFRPEALSNLCKLQILDLEDVPINDVLSNLESVFSGCLMFSLEELDLGDTHLRGSLPDWLGNFKNLKYLDLSYNFLYGSVPASLANLSSLQSLILYSNDLNGTISEGIGGLKGLINLDLSNNSFRFSEVHFANLSSLKFLDISYSYIDLDKGDDWIPPFQLQSLYMMFCQIVPRPHFPKWLRLQTTLRELSLSSTNIKERIPNWLPSSLEYLYLSNNEISGDVPQYLPNLIYLDLSNNSLSGHLPPRITNIMPHLQFLDLSGNKIAGELPQHFSKQTYYLDLSNNSFSSHLSSKISNAMQYLYRFDLSMNHLSGSIPLSFCQNKYLLVLRLSKNNLSGELPNCWKNSSSLFILDVSSNKLQGRIPDSLSNLQSLQSLHLSNNNLIGQIPLSLKGCTNLVTLDLAYNNFIGNIPVWIGESLSYLKTLSLRSNAFNGSIPELSHLISLQILDLSNNALSGSIPRSFGNFSALRGSPSYNSYFYNYSFSYDDIMWLFIKGSELEYTTRLLSIDKVIDLSNNSLSGYIPEELGNLHGLRSLNLSRNYLTGEIPSNINGMQQLEILDLSRNNLSGAIPSTLAALNFLSDLNLSYNNLSGRIPTGSQLQTFTDPSIYIGNSDLCGPPLTKYCPEDMPTKGKEEEEKKKSKDRIESIWLYMCRAVGFIVGFWTICGSILLNSRWRIAYFHAIDSMCDRLYVVLVLNVAMFKRKLLVGGQVD